MMSFNKLNIGVNLVYHFVFRSPTGHFVLYEFKLCQVDKLSNFSRNKACSMKPYHKISKIPVATSSTISYFGHLPVNLLDQSTNVFRLISCPISVGIRPVR
jgi:hypothetical protein